MSKRLKKWQTRTRNKILCAGLIFIGICILIVLVGWLNGREDASDIITALTGSGGVWATVNAVAISWEKKRSKE